jgi:aminopeptidase
MHDPRVDKLASVLVHYSVGIRPGDVVVISGNTAAEPAVVATYREVLRAGGQPWVRLVPEECSEVLLKTARPEQLKQLPPFEKHIMQNCNARIGIWADVNTRALSQVDPARQALVSRARKPIMDVFFKRAALPAKDAKRLRWTGTQYPTQASAQDAEMSLSEYADFVYNAGKLNERNPVAAWKKLGVAQQRLADFLQKGRTVHIRTPRGTDVRFGVKGRRWINCDGHENFPDGEVFTGPIEDATEGTVVFDFPAVSGGREVDGIRLVFKGGRVVDCSATKNEAFLVQMLDQDKGARTVGELAFGTNYGIKRYTRNTLFDEKIGGTFHLALGAAYPETGGRNVSALHWDLVCDLRKGGVVEVDGTVISKGGKFTKAGWPS